MGRIISADKVQAVAPYLGATGKVVPVGYGKAVAAGCLVEDEVQYVPGQKYKLLSWTLDGIVQTLPVNCLPNGDTTIAGLVGDTPQGNANSTIAFVPYTGNNAEGIDFIYWKLDTDGLPLFVADRCIVGGVPYNRLNALGFIMGRELELAGVGRFLIRSLTGGTSPTGFGDGGGGYGLSTAPANNNEWDDLFGGLVPVEGIPVPTAEEARRAYPYSPTKSDFLAELNQFMHWVCMDTWCQESFNSAQYACLRGYFGPRFWAGHNASSNTAACAGFRPVLKRLA